MKRGTRHYDETIELLNAQPDAALVKDPDTGEYVYDRSNAVAWSGKGALFSTLTSFRNAPARITDMQAGVREKPISHNAILPPDAAPERGMLVRCNGRFYHQVTEPIPTRQGYLLYLSEAMP